ncbi:carboxypeptidase-like regulatory domain-containing protein [Citrobacter sp. S2-9]|uniref:Carboxypeptidase-like regulatory domain-containing protein n=1 Tax=Citrobacter enshiensis TaxID=2971264 RepID=A0ABT8PRP5_9ENTR|nr:carboxypeptidase-like regulatory domain-containing protein [Citrobacter enshiensis]MDN8599003.1 carboxypeptidase-like regulatory domain-containing protein [Citrobacter enshiensis]
MATISGIFNDPFGNPLVRVVIELTARKTTTLTFTGTNAAAVTAADGSYSMSVLPGVYAVTANIQDVPDYLGIIQVYADSPDASLNQYLAAFNPDDVTPAILAEMQAILLATQAAARSAAASAELAASYALKYLGPYDAAVQYVKNDVVFWRGSEYKATDDVIGISPPDAPWELFVEKGGEGAPGPANKLAIGDVETLPAGSQATATITGDYPEQKLNLGIPEGNKGDPAINGVVSIDQFPNDEDGHIQLAEQTGFFINPSSYVHSFAPELKYLVETAYITLDSMDFRIDLSGIVSGNGDRTIDPGYTLRLAIGTNKTRIVNFVASGGYFRWIDGSQSNNEQLTISPGQMFLIQVLAVHGSVPFVVQLSPPM